MTVTNFRLTFSWRQFFAGLLFGILVLSMTSCSAGPRPISQGGRLSLAVGQSRAVQELDGQKVHAEGSSSSIRGDLFARPDYLPGLEAGARVGGVMRDLQASTEDQVGVDSELQGAYGALYLRQLVPVVEGIALYAEGFGGYGFESGIIEVGSQGELRVEDEAGTWMFGAGAGIEFNQGLSIGIEWSRRDFDLGPVDLEVQDLAVVVGGVLRF